MEGSRKKVAGYKIICRIERIERTDTPGLVLETTDTIQSVRGPIDIDMVKNKQSATLPGLDKVTIKAQDHVKVFAKDLSGGGIKMVL